MRINHLITDIRQTSLTISPMGMFDVSPRLLLVVKEFDPVEKIAL